jgi:hypothetical protein
VPFNTRDTVAGDVSAAFATSVIFVTRDFMFIAGNCVEIVFEIAVLY